MNLNYFNVVKMTNQCIEWIKNWFDQNGKDCNAVIGISGGKDSSVVAALCAKALGPERVIGVLMPNYVQQDIKDSYKICKHLGIKNYTLNIGDIYSSAHIALKSSSLDQFSITEQSEINLPARIRMTMLYAISQCNNGRVSNNCNLSENYIGYATRYGDGAGDFAPIENFTASEVVAIGKYLGLPDDLVDKTPADGLCGKTDEDNFGFTYDELDTYIRTGMSVNDLKDKIEHLHKVNQFKLKPIPGFSPNSNDLYKESK